MSEQGWSEWIEHKAGDPCPIPWAQPYDWRYVTGDDYDCDGSTACGPIDHYDAMWRGEVRGGMRRYRYYLNCAPAGFVPPGAEKPWYPPVPEGFSEWRPCNGVEPPELAAFCGSVAILNNAEQKGRYYCHEPFTAWHRFKANRDSWPNFAAYCVKLEDQPTQEQVEATQQPWSLEQDAADWAADSDLQNRPMFDADDVGVSAGKWDRFNARLAAPTAAPGFMVRAVRSSDGLLTVREADHRLGLWS